MLNKTFSFIFNIILFIFIIFSLNNIVISTTLSEKHPCDRFHSKISPFLREVISNEVCSETNKILSHKETFVLNNLRNNRDGDIRVWIFFNDKRALDYTPDQNRNEEEFHLTQEAIYRRQTRPQVPFPNDDETELPIYQPYIEQIEQLVGQDIRTQSKWLNAMSIVSPIHMLNSIANLSIVARVDAVHLFNKEKNHDSLSFSETEILDAPNELNEMNDNDSCGGDLPYEYGHSKSQVCQLNVPAAHAQGYRGQNVRVLVLDSGFRINSQTHESLPPETRILAQRDFVRNDNNTQNDSEDPSDQHNHGTEVLSVIGGSLNGSMVGPAVDSLFILGKTEDTGMEQPQEEDYFIAGLEWGENMGADLVTSSLGYSKWYQWTQLNGHTAPISIAVGEAARRGLICVIAAANSGFSGIAAPSDSEGALAIGAVDSQGDIAYFSSRGPSADGRIKPELCARGKNAICANPETQDQYKPCSGTSFATPLTAGVISIILSAHPSWNVAQVREAISQTASHPDHLNLKCGWGIPDVMAAINYDHVSELSGDCPRSCSGMSCDDGHCNCSNNTYGATCSLKKLKCSDWCMNGNCNEEGRCVCDNGYSGIYCSCYNSGCKDVDISDYDSISSSSSSSSSFLSSSSSSNSLDSSEQESLSSNSSSLSSSLGSKSSSPGISQGVLTIILGIASVGIMSWVIFLAFRS